MMQHKIIMDKIIELLETYKGRDRVLRLFSYFSKFLGGSLKSYKFASQFDMLSFQLSSARACFRLLDDLPTVVAISQDLGKRKEKQNLIQKALNILANMIDLVFGPLDHISWAMDHNIIISDNSYWSTASILCWVLSLYTSLYKTLNTICAVSQRKVQLHSKGSSDTYKKLAIQQKNLQLNILKLFMDLLFAVNYLPKGVLWAGLLSKQQVGALGTLSSLISLYQALFL